MQSVFNAFKLAETRRDDGKGMKMVKRKGRRWEREDARSASPPASLPASGLKTSGSGGENGTPPIKETDGNQTNGINSSMIRCTSHMARRRRILTRGRLLPTFLPTCSQILGS